MDRRGLLKGALFFGGAWAIMARPWNWFLPPRLEFEPFEAVPPFRQLANAGQVTAVGATDAVLVGIDHGSEPQDPALDNHVRQNVEDLILGGWQTGHPVPVTYFTDIRCPICRVLEPRLAALEGISLTTREFPLFGAISEQAARAIIAAARQGMAEAMRRRLQRSSFGIGPDTLMALAESIGLDGLRFAGDLDSAEVRGQLAEDQALARLFRMPGTPALIVGRTRVVGALPLDLLQALVEVEAAGST